MLDPKADLPVTAAAAAPTADVLDPKADSDLLVAAPAAAGAAEAVVVASPPAAAVAAPTADVPDPKAGAGKTVDPAQSVPDRKFDPPARLNVVVKIPDGGGTVARNENVSMAATDGSGKSEVAVASPPAAAAAPATTPDFHQYRDADELSSVPGKGKDLPVPESVSNSEPEPAYAPEAAIALERLDQGVGDASHSPQVCGVMNAAVELLEKGVGERLQQTQTALLKIKLTEQMGQMSEVVDDLAARESRSDSTQVGSAVTEPAIIQSGLKVLADVGGRPDGNDDEYVGVQSEIGHYRDQTVIWHPGPRVNEWKNISFAGNTRLSDLLPHLSFQINFRMIQTVAGLLKSFPQSALLPRPRPQVNREPSPNRP